LKSKAHDQNIIKKPIFKNGQMVKEYYQEANFQKWSNGQSRPLFRDPSIDPSIAK
jgi:hypothetical protein